MGINTVGCFFANWIKLRGQAQKSSLANRPRNMDRNRTVGYAASLFYCEHVYVIATYIIASYNVHMFHF